MRVALAVVILGASLTVASARTPQLERAAECGATVSLFSKIMSTAAGTGRDVDPQMIAYWENAAQDALKRAVGAMVSSGMPKSEVETRMRVAMERRVDVMREMRYDGRSTEFIADERNRAEACMAEIFPDR